MNREEEKTLQRFVERVEELYAGEGAKIDYHPSMWCVDYFCHEKWKSYKYFMAKQDKTMAVDQLSSKEINILYKLLEDDARLIAQSISYAAGFGMDSFSEPIAPEDKPKVIADYRESLAAEEELLRVLKKRKSRVAHGVRKAKTAIKNAFSNLIYTFNRTEYGHLDLEFEKPAPAPEETFSLGEMFVLYNVAKKSLAEYRIIHSLASRPVSAQGTYDPYNLRLEAELESNR